MADDAQEPSGEMVTLDQASDNDIDSFLDAVARQQSEDLGDEDDADIYPAAEDSRSQAKEKVDGQDGKGQGDKQDEQAQAQEAELARIRAKNEQLRAAIAKQNAYVQRRSSEIGELRKQLRVAQAQLAEGLNEKFIESPNDAMDAKLQIRANQQILERLDEEESALGARTENFKLVSTHIQPDEFDVTAMAESLARDGIDKEHVSEFMKDPFSFTDGTTLIQLAKRTYAENIARKLWAHVQELQGYVQSLRGQPAKVLENIQHATAQKPMTAASGGSRQQSKANVDNLDVSRLSDAEIDEFLKRARQRG